MFNLFQLKKVLNKACKLIVNKLRTISQNNILRFLQYCTIMFHIGLESAFIKNRKILL